MGTLKDCYSESIKALLIFPNHSRTLCHNYFGHNNRDLSEMNTFCISWSDFSPMTFIGGNVFECIATPGGPIKTEQSIQSIFQDFALINSYLFSPCWIEHLFLITITPRSSNLVENFLFYDSFIMDCHFRDLPDFQSSEARLMTN